MQIGCKLIRSYSRVYDAESDRISGSKLVTLVTYQLETSAVNAAWKNVLDPLWLLKKWRPNSNGRRNCIAFEVNYLKNILFA